MGNKLPHPKTFKLLKATVPKPSNCYKCFVVVFSTGQEEGAICTTTIEATQKLWDKIMDIPLDTEKIQEGVIFGQGAIKEIIK